MRNSSLIQQKLHAFATEPCQHYNSQTDQMELVQDWQIDLWALSDSNTSLHRMFYSTYRIGKTPCQLCQKERLDNPNDCTAAKCLNTYINSLCFLLKQGAAEWLYEIVLISWTAVSANCMERVRFPAGAGCPQRRTMLLLLTVGPCPRQDPPRRLPPSP